MNPIDVPSDAELLAYLDEALEVERSATIERLLRSDPKLSARAAGLLRERDQGGHTIGEIWRRNRLSCPSRSQLKDSLKGTVSAELADYVRFHLNEVGCRFCQANLEDLRNCVEFNRDQRTQRRYFESSAGVLRDRSRNGGSD